MQEGIFWDRFFKVKSKIHAPQKDGSNDFANNHKYTKLESLLDHITPALEEEDIHFHFEDVNSEDQAGVTCHFKVILGESVVSEYSQTTTVDKGKRDPQGTGSCYTYCKRYLMLSMFGFGDPNNKEKLVSTDDDAHYATNAKVDTSKIKAECKKAGVEEQLIFNAVGIKSWDDATDKDVEVIKQRLKDYKKRKAA